MSALDVIEGRARWSVDQGDCLELLKTLPPSSVDAVVTDPPAGISFMGAKWDGDKGGRDAWIAWLQSVMVEALRVLKPGGHALVWALPRTSHWTATACENAGFEIRDRVAHIFATGFPKSLNVSVAIDKVLGAERKRIGERVTGSRKRLNGKVGMVNMLSNSRASVVPVTEPATAAAAAALQGWGTALKPATEDYWLCRKPFRGGVAANVLAHGTGAINVDGCRVGDAERINPLRAPHNSYGGYAGTATATATAGRWPSHLVLSHAPGCELVGQRKVKAAPPWNDNRPPSLFTGEHTSPVQRADGDGAETIDDWRCVDGCPCAELDRQSGDTTSSDATRHNGAFKSVAKGAETAHDSTGYADEGGCSRYFNTFAADPALFKYAAKASTFEKEVGLEHRKRRKVNDGRSAPNDTPYLRDEITRANTHPTPKSIALMRWLCRLITPPGGLVLDPFAGSGSTGVACSQEGFRFIGFELSEEFAGIARDRILGDSPLLNRAGGGR